MPALLCGGMPLVCAVATGRRQAREEAAAHAAATEAERSGRILLKERAVVARELHDVVVHHMSIAAVRENAVAALAELRRVLGAVRAEPAAGGDGVTAGAAEAPQPGPADLVTLLERVRATGVPVEETVRGAVRELPRGVELVGVPHRPGGAEQRPAARSRVTRPSGTRPCAGGVGRHRRERPRDGTRHGADSAGDG